jgi:hypothetical protein
MVQKSNPGTPYKDKDDMFMGIMASKLSKWDMLKLRAKMLLGIPV